MCCAHILLLKLKFCNFINMQVHFVRIHGLLVFLRTCFILELVLINDAKVNSCFWFSKENAH